MSITFGVNKSPFAGRVGKLLTSRNIRDRLSKELETNVALRVEDTDDGDPSPSPNPNPNPNPSPNTSPNRSPNPAPTPNLTPTLTPTLTLTLSR